jgi:hypothetical protein
VPKFYINSSPIGDLVDHSVGRILDLFDLDTAGFDRWEGREKDQRSLFTNHARGWKWNYLGRCKSVYTYSVGNQINYDTIQIEGNEM